MGTCRTCGTTTVFDGRCTSCCSNALASHDDVKAERDHLATENAELRKNTFPIMTDKSGPTPIHVPLSVAEKAYSVYVQRFGKQPLDRIAKRGGFYAAEMDDLYPDWRDEVSEIKMLTEQLAAANATLDALREAVPDYDDNWQDWEFGDLMRLASAVHRILYPQPAASIRDIAERHGFAPMPPDLGQRNLDGETIFVGTDYPQPAALAEENDNEHS